MRKPTFVLLLIPAFAIACSSDDDASLGSGGSSGFGASTGSGGFVTTGGSTSTGGSGATSGSGGASSGGASGASGASGAGGASGASGASGAGGASGASGTGGAATGGTGGTATGGTGGAATGGTGGAATGGTGGAATGGTGGTATGGTGGAATGGTGGAATGGTGGSATGGTGGAATGGTGGAATGGTGGSATGGTGGTGGCSASAHVVINELVPNPPSSDNGKEWLELYNPTCSAVSIAGWVIESATSTFGPTFTLPNGASIPSLGYVVIGGADVTFADFKKTTALNMGNASGSADAVRLVNALSAVIDTVIYGSPNSDAFKDDTGAVATSLAPTPTSSQALARIPNGSDTDQCGADFIATHNLTPKAVNAP